MRYLIAVIAIALLAATPAPSPALTLADITPGTPYDAGHVTFTFNTISSRFSFQPGMGLDDVPIDFFDGGFTLGTTFTVQSKAEMAGVDMSFVVTPNFGTPDVAYHLLGRIAINDPNLVFVTLDASPNSLLPHDPGELALNFRAFVSHTVCSPFVPCSGRGSLSTPGIVFQIPEPTTLAVLSGGLMALIAAASARRRRP